MFGDTVNITDFLTFVGNQGITTAELPTNSDFPQQALTWAQNTVMQQPGTIPNIVYVMAVYNLGFHLLLGICPDQSGQTTFVSLRKSYGLLGFVGGVISATSDNSTSETLVSPDFLKGLRMQDLDYIKTPWGRQYLMYAQAYGPTIVDVT